MYTGDGSNYRPPQGSLFHLYLQTLHLTLSLNDNEMHDKYFSNVSHMQGRGFREKKERKVFTGTNKQKKLVNLKEHMLKEYFVPSVLEV